MGSVIGDILPLALGIAISPIPIIAAILMLLSPKAKGTSVGFLLGWILGIVVAVVLFTLLASVITPSDPDASKPIAGTIKILLGLCPRSIRVRPGPSSDSASSCLPCGSGGAARSPGRLPPCRSGWRPSTR